jgi:hypothetical protein
LPLLYSAIVSAEIELFRQNSSLSLFVRNGALVAQEMDRRNFELRGEPIRIADSVATDGPSNFGDFSVSKDGTLAFNSAVHQHELIWLDRAGNRIGSGSPVDRYSHPALARDARQAVFDRNDPKTTDPDLWKLDVDRGEVSLFERGGGFYPCSFRMERQSGSLAGSMASLSSVGRLWVAQGPWRRYGNQAMRTRWSISPRTADFYPTHTRERSLSYGYCH